MDNIDLKVQSQVRHEKWKRLCQSKDNIMDKPRKENYTKGVSQIELPQATTAYYRALEKYCDFKDEMEVRSDLQHKESIEKMEKYVADFESTFFPYAPAYIKAKWLDENGGD